MKQKTPFKTEFCSDRDRIRTYDRLLRRQMLYPAELRDQSMRRDWDSNPGNVYTLTD